MVPEGGVAKVSCRARGMPTPRIMWRREDGADIVLRDPNGGKTKGMLSWYNPHSSVSVNYLCSKYTTKKKQVVQKKV